MKKLSASLMMLLFFVVLGTKAVHSHDNDETQQQGIVLLKAGGCDICDFQLSREAELPPAIEASKVECYLFRETSIHEVKFFSTSPATVLGRGPPAV